MHAVDLGVGQDVVGGFWEAVVQPGLFESGTLDGRMKELWNMIQSFYKHNPEPPCGTGRVDLQTEDSPNRW